MFFQRAIAWAVLLVLVGLTVFGLLANGVLQQKLWEPAGLERLLAFAGIYVVISACAILVAPRWYLYLIAGLTFVYTGLAVGFAAPAAIVYLAASCWAAGAICFRSHRSVLRQYPQVPFFLGIGAWTFLVMATARWPVHYQWLYWLLPALPILYALRSRLWPEFQMEYARTRRDLAALAATLFPLLCAWLGALKPEVSSDALAMHMVIPSHMASAHHWPFNVKEFTWAVMPMGGDWAYTFAWMMGGEAAARLLNCALLALIAWTLYELIHARLPGWMCAALVGGFLATPLTQHVTASMFVENFVAAMLFGSMMLLWIHAEERSTVSVLGWAFLAGMAGASKLGCWAFIVPMLVAAAFLVKPRRVLQTVPILAVVGGFPYWEAWLRTQNPIFPMFNAWFRSPYYHQAVNFRDGRFLTPLSKTTWYDITFHSHRFIEGLDGSMGVLFFIVVPLCVVGWRRDWPRFGKVLLSVSLAGFVLTYLGQSNLRYLYAALPMFTLLAGLALVSIRTQSAFTCRAIAATAALAFLLNLYLMPAAGYYNHGFALNQVLDRTAVARYLGEMAPERLLVRWLNANDPHATVAWLEGNAIADFPGVAVTNSWHSEPFFTKIGGTTSAESMAELARSLKVDYFIAPSAISWRATTNLHTRVFLEVYTLPVTEVQGLELRLWSRGKRPPPFAGAGKYDEYNQFVTFEGHWIRDLQFTSALQGTLVYTKDPRSSLEVHFRGSAVRLIYTAATNRCEGVASIDHGTPFRINEYSAVTRWQSVSEPFRAANFGEHTLQLAIRQDEGKGKGTGCYLDLDGFIVE